MDPDTLIQIRNYMLGAIMPLLMLHAGILLFNWFYPNNQLRIFDKLRVPVKIEPKDNFNSRGGIVQGTPTEWCQYEFVNGKNKTGVRLAKIVFTKKLWAPILKVCSLAPFGAYVGFVIITFFVPQEATNPNLAIGVVGPVVLLTGMALHILYFALKISSGIVLVLQELDEVYRDKPYYLVLVDIVPVFRN